MSTSEKSSAPTGLEGREIYSGGKRLRLGFTTGTCAAASSKAAARMLLGEKILTSVSLTVPKGITLTLPVTEVSRGEGWCSCAVMKDAGDDPDVTDGVLVFSRVEKIPGEEILLRGGEGVGRVTLPGLPCPVGEAAINPVPRRMILEALTEARREYSYPGGLLATLSIPGGEERAKRTFNPRLGIVGGLSILGTTGIVEPMSERALVDTIRAEMWVRLAGGERVLLAVPGNFSAAFCSKALSLPSSLPVLCSNYIGETIDLAQELGAQGLLFVSHIGKFVKTAGGIMNTHSHQADCRMEILCSACVRAGAPLSLARSVLSCATTDAALERIEKEGFLSPVMEDLLSRMDLYLSSHSYHDMPLGAIVYTGENRVLGQTKRAGELLERIRRKNYTRGS